MIEMKKESSNKQIKTHNQTLMTLSSSVNGEPTKKFIETDEMNHQETHFFQKRKYLFQMPLMSDISSIISMIAAKFNQDIIHAEEHSDGGHILLKGINPHGFRRFLAKMIDTMTFCCKRTGVKRGSLEETFNVISIMVKKQILQKRCVIVISNPYYHSPLHPVFMEKIINVIEVEVKLLEKQQSFESMTDLMWVNPYRSRSSPTQVEIYIFRLVFQLLFHKEGKPETVFNKAMNKCLEAINEEISKHFKQLKAAHNNLLKQNLTNPSTITQTLIKQTFTLMETLYLSNSTEEPEIAFFNALSNTEVEKQICHYSIEAALCLPTLAGIKQIYFLNTKEQCEAFNEHNTFLNETLSNEECFDHLELKQKYRLPTEESPYLSAIQALKSISLNFSIREMLLTVQKVFSNVKTDCLSAHHGKLELSSMDDLLPVMIFVTVRANVQDFPAYVKLIDDYIKLKQVFQVEERVITTLYVAVEDISKKWTINSSKKSQK